MQHRVNAFVLCAETELAKAAALPRFPLGGTCSCVGGSSAHGQDSGAERCRGKQRAQNIKPEARAVCQIVFHF
jgi:hypothetical protein